ncbi:Scr1 family TA system antitoxin-like transcriptional regulator [Nocardiopsis sp. FIRDI 009]|uniref:Scr1 family TA system antitoxin-like transcriptional regulator n=1 Tax=Nocardiopsis sp. FIRDI 009 TaxID=714197 RepID=UPI0035144B44
MSETPWATSSVAPPKRSLNQSITSSNIAHSLHRVGLFLPPRYKRTVRGRISDVITWRSGTHRSRVPERVRPRSDGPGPTTGRSPRNGRATVLPCAPASLRHGVCGSGSRGLGAQVIPGPCRVPGYTADIFRGARHTEPSEIERRAEGRMARRGIPVRPNPGRLHAVIDEALFPRPVGGRKVVVDQSKHSPHSSASEQRLQRLPPHRTGGRPCFSRTRSAPIAA